uniref:Uncharacterized protein n=1 Tax=Physcomitrium patens TaxID=3218 RepID=A0A2K1KJC6_PHYPA|nr:hypothetical protein PHYPA_007553 [Physcomitrium patens]
MKRSKNKTYHLDVSGVDTKGEGRFLVGDVKMSITQMSGDKKDVAANTTSGRTSWGRNVVSADATLLTPAADKNSNLLKQF